MSPLTRAVILGHTFPDPATQPQRSANPTLARNRPMRLPYDPYVDGPRPGDDGPPDDPTVCEPTPYPEEERTQALRSALEVERYLLIAEAERGTGTNAEYSATLDDLCTGPGGIDDAMADLDADDVLVIAREVIRLLRAKSDREGAK